MLGQASGTRSRESKSGFVQSLQLAAGIILALALAVLLSAGCGRTGGAGTTVPVRALAVAANDQTRATFSTATIDFGFLPPGARSEQIITLSNKGGTPLILAKLRTSCECLVAQCEQKVIGPAESVPVLIRIDLSDDPGFAGGLLMSVEALDQSDKLIGTVSVAVTADSIARAFATE